MSDWYVLRVVSGFEDKVKEEIMEAGRGDSPAARVLSGAVESVEVFSEERAVVRFGKKVNIKSGVMPGYLMIKMDYLPEVANIIRTRKNVIGFLGGNGDVPSPVSEEEVLRLRATVAKKDEAAAFDFSVGGFVKINEGPFASFTGVIDEVDAKKKKLRVAVAILGRKIPVILDNDQVEKVNKDGE